MRIFVFAEHYPNVYKPYLDDQLSALLDMGHSVEVYAFGKFSSKVHSGSLALRDTNRITYLPATLRDSPRFIPTAFRAALVSPGRAVRALRIAASTRGSWRAALVHALRMMLMREWAADICLVHNLATIRMYSWLKSLIPEARVALYYHGAEIVGTPEILDARELISSADLVLTNTEYSREAVIERGALPERTHVLPVGFALSDFPLETRTRTFAEDGLRLVSVGRLSQEKGIDVALRAIAKVRDQIPIPISYTIIGDGPIRESLRQTATSLRLDDVVSFAGTMVRGEILPVLMNSDVLILPSIALGKVQETQACVVQEAMLSGVLVLASRTGGVAEGVPSPMKEFLFEPGNAEALGTLLVSLSSRSPVEVAALAAGGNSFVRRNYGADVLAERLIRIATNTGQAR